jgi:hypothetical protein
MTLEKNAQMGPRGNGIVSQKSPMSINTFTLRCSFCSPKRPAFISFEEMNLRVEKQNGELFIVFSCPYCGAELLQHKLRNFDCSTMSMPQKDKLIKEIKKNPSDIPNRIIDKEWRRTDRTIDSDKLREWLGKEAELIRLQKVEAIKSKEHYRVKKEQGKLAEVKRIAKAMDWGEFDIEIGGV